MNEFLVEQAHDGSCTKVLVDDNFIVIQSNEEKWSCNTIYVQKFYEGRKVCSCIRWQDQVDGPMIVDVDEDKFENFLLFLQQNCVGKGEEVKPDIKSSIPEVFWQQKYVTNGANASRDKFLINGTDHCFVGVHQGEIFVESDTSGKWEEWYRGDRIDVMKNPAYNESFIVFDKNNSAEYKRVDQDKIDDLLRFLEDKAHTKKDTWLYGKELRGGRGLWTKRYLTLNAFDKEYPSGIPGIIRPDCLYKNPYLIN